MLVAQQRELTGQIQALCQAVASLRPLTSASSHHYPDDASQAPAPISGWPSAAAGLTAAACALGGGLTALLVVRLAAPR